MFICQMAHNATKVRILREHRNINAAKFYVIARKWNEHSDRSRIIAGDLTNLSYIKIELYWAWTCISSFCMCNVLWMNKCMCVMVGFDSIFHSNCMTFDYWIHTRVRQITVDLFPHQSKIPAINVKTNITRELVMQKNWTFVWTSQTRIWYVVSLVGFLWFYSQMSSRAVFDCETTHNQPNILSRKHYETYSHFRFGNESHAHSQLTIK